jgi:hypothetical protein
MDAFGVAPRAHGNGQQKRCTRRTRRCQYGAFPLTMPTSGGSRLAGLWCKSGTQALMGWAWLMLPVRLDIPFAASSRQAWRRASCAGAMRPHNSGPHSC